MGGTLVGHFVGRRTKPKRSLCSSSPSRLQPTWARYQSQTSLPSQTFVCMPSPSPARWNAAHRNHFAFGHDDCRNGIAAPVIPAAPIELKIAPRPDWLVLEGTRLILRARGHSHESIFGNGPSRQTLSPLTFLDAAVDRDCAQAQIVAAIPKSAGRLTAGKSRARTDGEQIPMATSHR